jgi:probable HAF family extracellular repeat protein
MVLGRMDDEAVNGLAISADGSTVVGQTSVLIGKAPHPFRWTQKGGFIDLGWPEKGLYGSGAGRAVSRDGSVVAGDCYFDGYSDGEAMRFSSLGPLCLIPRKDRVHAAGISVHIAGSLRSTAYAVSGDGAVLAGSKSTPSGMKAFRWTEAGGLTAMETIPGPTGQTHSEVHGLSADGTVAVGAFGDLTPAAAQNINNAVRAFRWTQQGGMKELKTAGANQGFVPVAAWAVSADGGVVVGVGKSDGTPPTAREGFRWTEAGGAVPLGELPGGVENTIPESVSADGSIVVGKASNQGADRRAFLWEQATGMHDLQSALTRDYGLNTSEWKLQDAKSVSADGRTIMGTAFAAGDAAQNRADAVLTWVVTLSPTGKELFSREAATPSKKMQGPSSGAEPAQEARVVPLPEPLLLKGDDSRCLCAKFATGVQTLATLNESSQVKLWDLSSGKERAAFPGQPGEHIRYLAVSPGGELVATLAVPEAMPNGANPQNAKRPDTLTIWDVTIKSKIRTIELPESKTRPLCLAFAPDGKSLAVAIDEESVRLFDVTTGNEAGKLWCLPIISSLAYKADGKRVAAGCGAGQIRLWDFAGGIVEKNVLTGCNQGPGALAFSPGGDILAEGGSDESIRLWNMEKGVQARLTAQYPRLGAGQSRSFVSLAFSPDGKLLASTSSGATECVVSVWDTSTGKERLRFAHPASFADLFFPTADKLWIAGGDSAGTFWLWKVDLAAAFAAPPDYASMLPPTARGAENAKTTPPGVRATHVADGPRARVEQLPDIVVEHGQNFPRLRFSQDGSLAAIPLLVRADSIVKVWHQGDKGERATFNAEQTKFYDVAFSPDNKLLAAAGEKIGDSDAAGVVNLWDLTAGKAAGTLPVPNGPVARVCFSPDGKTLVSVGGAGSVRLWEVASRQEVANFPGETASVDGLAISPDGSLLAVACRERTVRLIDLREKKELPIIRFKEEEGPRGAWGFSSLQFTKDGKTLAIAKIHGDVLLWDIPKGELRSARTTVPGSRPSLSISPDSSVIAIASPNGSLRLWEPNTDRTDDSYSCQVEPHRGRMGGFGDAHFLPDGKLLVTSSGAGWHVNLRRIERAAGRAISNATAAPSNSGPSENMTPKTAPATKTESTPSSKSAIALPEPVVLTGHTKPVWSLTLTPDGQTLATSDSESELKTWDIATAKERAAVAKSSFAIRALAVSPVGDLLAAGGGERARVNRSGVVKTFNAVTGREVGRLEGHTSHVVAAVYSRVGYLATGGADGVVKVWDVDGKELQSLAQPDERIATLAFSAADGNLLAVGCESGTVRLWDVRAGTERKTLKGTAGGVSSLAFARDGATLAVGNSRGSVSLWDTSDTSKGEQRSILRGQGRVVSLAFSDDGNTLASAGIDGTTKVWDVKAGTERASYSHDPGWTLVRFVPDGKLLIATGTKQGPVKVWRVDMSAE